MRTLLIPVLTLLLGAPAFAHDEQQDWKYRTPRRPQLQQENEAYLRQDGHRYGPRYGHDRARRHYYSEREVIVVRPPVVHVRPRPLPPPPIGIQLWFGF
jgi:hypothetical protein